MRGCSLCGKRADLHENIRKCQNCKCFEWIHKTCGERKLRSKGFNWTCRKHMKDVILALDAGRSCNERAMAIPRTPPSVDGNENTNEVRNNSLIVSETVSENDTFNDLNDSVIIRQNPDNTVNENKDCVNSSINSNTDNNANATQSSLNVENPATSAGHSRVNNEKSDNSVKRICYKCRYDATVRAYLCKGCKNYCHPACTNEDEESTVDTVNESFVCDICLSLLKSLNNKSADANKSNNASSRQPRLNVPYNNNVNSNENTRNINKDQIPQEEESDDLDDDDDNDDYSPHAYPQNNFRIPNKVSANNNLNLNATVTPEIFFYKLQYKKLPEVVDSDISWSVFYATYTETKQLFTDHENVVRVQEAIKDEHVKRIGGKGLINLRTYDTCIQNINKRLKHNFNFINNEATAIENHIKIRAENKVKLVEFMDKVRNFHTLAEAYNDFSYITNRRFLANVIDVIPNYLRNKWEAKQALLENAGRVPSLNDMIIIFDKELPRLEASIRNDKLRHRDNKVEHNNQKFPDRRHRLNNVTTNSNDKFSTFKGQSSISASHYINKDNRQEIFCWFHKTNDHKSNHCKVLWELDGKIVSDLARANKICTFCGQKLHKPCPLSSKLKCRIDGCEYPHLSLFCYRRKGNKSKSETVHHNKETFKFKGKSKDKDDNPRPSTSKDAKKSHSSQDLQLLADQLKQNSYYTNLPDDLSDYLEKFQAMERSSHLKVNFDDKCDTNSNKDSCYQHNLLGILVIKVENKKELAFLIDSGSSVSLIEEKEARDLNARGPWLPLQLTWSGNQKRSDYTSRIVELKVADLSNENSNKLLYFRTVKDLNMSPQMFDADKFCQKYPKFKSLNLKSYRNIAGIIGVDNPLVFNQLNMIKVTTSNGIEFHGVKCPLGDYVYGSDNPLSKIFKELKNKQFSLPRNNAFSHNTLSIDEQDELNLMEKEVMGLDFQNPTENDREIYEEKYALDLLNAKVKRIEGSNKFVAPLLWNDENIKLPTDESYKMALRRFLIVEKQALKLNRHEECAEQIRNLISKGYAKELSSSEIHTPHNKAYYNPIFFIHPPNKRTRLIWDLAAKIDGKSLNDYIVPGPNLYNSLLEILFKMRENDYLVKGDLAEMFHQIHVDEDDTNALRFFFRFSTNEKIKVFKMVVLPFGAKCSPVISQFIKNKVAKEHVIKFPEIANTIINYGYVDDFVRSFKSVLEAVMQTVVMKRILHDGGFTLLKINANNESMLKFIQKSLNDNELSNEKLFSAEDEEKLLGYCINFKDDTISIANDLCKIPKEIMNDATPTKRQVLQIVMSIFDPIGLLQFITSKFKLVYHRVCVDKLEWDIEINEKDIPLWNRCIDWLKLCGNIKIPRVYCSNNSKVNKVQLWCFGDAGKDMMCGVIYFRFLDKNNEQINVQLAYAKSFTVPCRQKRTIPELELDVACKITEMAETVNKMHNLQIEEVKYLTDSLVVKEWICIRAKKASIYVKNRLDKINARTQMSQWLWIPTELNPADFGTKETAMPDISYNNDWFMPKLFRCPEKNWTFMSNNEQKPVNIHQDIVENEVQYNILSALRFSKLNSLISIGQIALKWRDIVQARKMSREISKVTEVIRKDKHNRSLKRSLVTLKENHKALRSKIDNQTFYYSHVENLAIKLAQFESFEDEVNLLSKEKSLPKNNLLFKLSPFLDENGLLRAMSRISHTDENVKIYGYDRIFPIILPKTHHLTKLYILKYHENNHHMLNNLTMTALMKRFHVAHIKSTVNSVIRQNCFVCKRVNAKPQIPMMGNLPAARLAFHSPPFTFCIMDLAGPIVIKNYRGREVKRYIFVYGCLTTRAVHLELIEDLTSNASLIALQNVINLRGAPEEVTSDNGTNFRGAEAILKEAQNAWNKKLMANGIIVKPIKWNFAPAKAPHMQGAIERFVGLAKSALNKMTTTLNKSPIKYNDFFLRAVLYEITGMLNNRPISLYPMEGSTTEFLTPNYFLMGRQNIQTTPICEKIPFNLQEYWYDIKILTNILWKHWLSAYVPSIMMREKWVDKCTPLETDDIVLVADPSIPNIWRIGRIIEIKPGSNDQVRSITLKLGKNKHIDIKRGKNSKAHLIKVYKEEAYSIITRPALAVAKLQL